MWRFNHATQEKKRLSLERDCRNNYGENDKSSRKNIPRSKQRDHKRQRQVVSQAIGSLKGHVDDSRADDVELVARNKLTHAKRSGFKKRPDIPLGVLLTKTGKRPR